jgi:hypothetical protein
MMWDDKADDLLIRLWDEGGSLSYVANGMVSAGYQVSRNAVAGRKHRLPVEAFRRRTTVSTMTTKRESSMRERSTPVSKITTRRPVTAAEVEAIAQHPGVEYLDQPRWGCKAIMPTRGGEWKLQRVCGQPRCLDYNGSMSSYCATHFRLYTNPVPMSRRQHV